VEISQAQAGRECLAYVGWCLYSLTKVNIRFTKATCLHKFDLLHAIPTLHILVSIMISADRSGRAV
jgi:hypothetical protein